MMFPYHDEHYELQYKPNMVYPELNDQDTFFLYRFLPQFLLPSTPRQQQPPLAKEPGPYPLLRPLPGTVLLCIGGEIFVTHKLTLVRYPDSHLAKLVKKAQAELAKAQAEVKNGEVLDEPYLFIDRDGTHFRYILNYLRGEFALLLYFIHEFMLTK
jgi:hypothetical protein